MLEYQAYVRTFVNRLILNRIHIPSIPPLFVPTLALIAGITSSHFSVGLCIQWSICMLLALPYLLIMLTKRSHASVPLIIALTLFSFIAGGARYKGLFNRHKQFHTQLYKQPVSITGQVINKQKSVNNTFRQILYLQPQIITLKTTQQSIQCPAPIKLYVAKEILCPIGATIHVDRIYWPNRPTQRQSLYLLSQRLSATLFIRNNPITVLSEHCTYPAYLKLLWPRWRYHITQRLRKKMSPECFQFFNSFFLGAPLEDTPFTQTLKNDLQRWGLLHFLARSGFHVILMATLWRYILQLLPLTYGLVNFLVCILLLIFWLISWPAASFYRAIASFIIGQFLAFKTGIMFPLHTLTLVCYIMLLLNPFFLFFLGFQLSFLLSAVLILLGEIKRRELRHTPLR